MTEFRQTPGTPERACALRQSDRDDKVFAALVEVLEEAPEVLSGEYSDDLFCDLFRSYLADVTIQEIVSALGVLSARAIALRELMQEEETRFCRPSEEMREA